MRITITGRAVREYTRRSEHGAQSFYWRRTINGTPYSFTFVVMPNGERRYSVRRYNGYLSDMITAGVTTWESVLRFDCAWSPVHFITVKPDA